MPIVAPPRTGFDQNEVEVYLREADPASYRGTIADHATIAISRADQQIVLERDIDPGPGYVAADEHEMVFAAQGEKITMWVDGREVATARDGSCRSGWIQVPFYEKTRIKKVEYAELEPAPTNPPAAPK